MDHRLPEDAAAAPWADQVGALLATAHNVAARLLHLPEERHEIEDVVSESMTALYEKWVANEPVTNPKGFVGRVAYTKAINRKRRQKQWKRRFAEVARSAREGTDPRSVEEGEAEQRLIDVLEAMPPRLKACFALRYFDTLTVPEIADLLGIKVETVRSYISAARKIVYREMS